MLFCLSPSGKSPEVSDAGVDLRLCLMSQKTAGEFIELDCEICSYTKRDGVGLAQRADGGLTPGKKLGPILITAVRKHIISGWLRGCVLDPYA